MLDRSCGALIAVIWGIVQNEGGQVPRNLFSCLFFIAAALVAAESSIPNEHYTPAERKHWSFHPRTQPEIPQFATASDRAWTKNPIDAFILAVLQKSDLAPAPKADSATLIRRLTFDLTGLPPTPAEISAFLSDKSSGANAKLIDRLLASPQYGEKWGQHWLDLVRFSETDGFEYDTHRHDAWRYRDYVIRSFNRDKSYAEFLKEQLAGDEISKIDEEMRIASGFNRLGPLRKNAGNQEVASSRNEQLTEMTNIVGSALLGVTLGCARCHDHKFDPIRQKDYYRIQAYFAEAQPEDVPLAGPDEQAAWKAKAAPVEKQIADLKKAMKHLDDAQKTAAEKQLEDLQDSLPEPLPTLFSVNDDPAKRSAIHVLARGDYQNKGDAVAPRPLGVLLSEGIPELPPDVPNPRKQLVDWIVDPQNPLTARVIVNRIWTHHFGRGIVATPNDFGRMGTKPTHPELLDYLANEFVANGFHFKALHKQILMSNTYQQAYKTPLWSAGQSKDPNNKLLWHFQRRRLDAEEIRDAELAIAGRLNLKGGGPSVMVPVDDELIHLLYKPSQWQVNKNPEDHDRRSIYLIAKRNLRLPMMEVFDSPDMQTSCPRRESSTHAPQALELMNGSLSNEMARKLAERLTKEAGRSPSKQVDLAYRLVAGRSPNEQEKLVALGFLEKQPLAEFALAMLNLNAFLYVE